MAEDGNKKFREIFDLCLAANVPEKAMRFFDAGISVTQVRAQLFPDQQTNGRDHAALDKHD